MNHLQAEALSRVGAETSHSASIRAPCRDRRQGMRLREGISALWGPNVHFNNVAGALTLTAEGSRRRGAAPLRAPAGREIAPRPGPSSTWASVRQGRVKHCGTRAVQPGGRAVRGPEVAVSAIVSGKRERWPASLDHSEPGGRGEMSETGGEGHGRAALTALGVDPRSLPCAPRAPPPPKAGSAADYPCTAWKEPCWTPPAPSERRGLRDVNGTASRPVSAFWS